MLIFLKDLILSKISKRAIESGPPEQAITTSPSRLFFKKFKVLSIFHHFISSEPFFFKIALTFEKGLLPKNPL